MKNQYQIYAVDINGRLTHAGVRGLKTNLKSIIKMEKKWLAWKKQYIMDHPGDYPLKHTEKTVKIYVHSIDNPNIKRSFTI